MRYRELPRQIVLLSHSVKMPEELEAYTARFDMALPSVNEREQIIHRVAKEWSNDNPGARVQTDPKAYGLLIRNLAGLTYKICNEKQVDVTRIRPELPLCLSRIINKAMRKQREDRYKNGAQMAKSLRLCRESL